MKNFFILVFVLWLFSACSSHNPDAVVVERNNLNEVGKTKPSHKEDAEYAKYQDPTNLYAGKEFNGFYKIGNPYKLDNTWYYPKADETYAEEGFASWYGSDFHAIKTANNETFDKDSVSAGHRTLPMPSIVRVTNLENDKTIYVRINDRGPFFADRIIDLSEKSSWLLGIKKEGTAKVRVEFAKEQTDRMFEDDSHESYNRNDLKKAFPKNEFVGVAPKKEDLGDLIYFVQLGALSNQKDASALLAKIRKKYGAGEVSVFESDIKKYYRVRLGPFNKLSEADKKLQKVKIEYNKAIIVSEHPE